MWTKTFEPTKSLVNGEIVNVPAIISDNGTKIVRGGYTSGGKRIIKYKIKEKTIDIILSNKDKNGKSTNLFNVYLEMALFSARNDGVNLDNEIKEKIKSDLKEALLGWMDIIDPGEPPISSVNFVETNKAISSSNWFKGTIL